MTDRETTQEKTSLAFVTASIPTELLHEVATALDHRADHFHGLVARLLDPSMDQHRTSLTRTAHTLESLARFMRDQWTVKFREMYPGYAAQNEGQAGGET